MQGDRNHETAPTNDEIGAYYLALLRLHSDLIASDCDGTDVEAVGVRYTIEMLEAHYDHIPDD